MEYDYIEQLGYNPELQQFLRELKDPKLKAEGDLRRQKEAYQNKIENLKKLFQIELCKARMRSKLNQAEAAKKLGVTQTAISKIEIGNPSLLKLIRYTDAIGAKLELSVIIK